MVNITISGLESIINKLKRLSGNIEENVKSKVDEEVELIARDARELCPVDTSHLRSSIQTRTTLGDRAVTGEVYSNTEYAAYVELGTGIRGEQAGLVREGLTLAYSPDWAGMTPQPYLYPAMKAHEDEIKEQFRAAVRMELK